MFVWSRNFLVIGLSLISFAPSFSLASAMCEELFEEQVSSGRLAARAALLDIMNELRAADAQKSQAAKEQRQREQEQAKLLEAQRAADLQKTLSQVTDLESWNRLAPEYKLEVVSWGRDMPNFKVFTAGAEKPRVWQDLSDISALKDPKHKKFANGMLKFMNENSDLTAQNGDPIGKLEVRTEVIVSKDGDIVGGVIFISQKLNDHQGVERDVASGYFDNKGQALKYDESMQYDH